MTCSALPHLLRFWLAPTEPTPLCGPLANSPSASVSASTSLHGDGVRYLKLPPKLGYINNVGGSYVQYSEINAAGGGATRDDWTHDSCALSRNFPPLAVGLRADVFLGLVNEYRMITWSFVTQPFAYLTLLVTTLSTYGMFALYPITYYVMYVVFLVTSFLCIKTAHCVGSGYVVR